MYFCLCPFRRDIVSNGTSGLGQRINQIGPNEIALDKPKKDIILSKSSSFGNGTLLISRDGDDDISSIRVSTTARTSTTDMEFELIKKSSNGHTVSTNPDELDFPQETSTGCGIWRILKSCWSWFCGLDNTESENGNRNDVSYQAVQRTIEDNDARDFILQHKTERPLIKRVLNGNLILIVLVEISLFVIFSIPAKYTFARQ